MPLGAEDEDLARAVSACYGLPLHPEEVLHGGEECRVIKARHRGRHFVIRVSPSWRSLVELTWAYELATYAATRIPEALAPIRTHHGTFAFEHEGRVVSVFPFADGAMLDRSSDRERDGAAQLLARLHCVLPMWPSARPRPAARPDAMPRVPRVDPAGLDDAELDAAVATITAAAQPALVHGDFYRGNLRVVDGRITALFDWDDARLLTLEYELAWSVWEFAQTDHEPTLDVERATRFLGAYAGAGGPVSLGDRRFVVPLIRDGLRREVRHAAALAEEGIAYDPAYIARAGAAFSRLRDSSL